MAAKVQPRKPRRSIFLRASFLTAMAALLALAVFAFAIVRHEQQMATRHIGECASLLAASIDRVTANAIVAEDYEPVISQCLKMVESSDNVLYVVVTRAHDGFSLVHDKMGWRMETLDGMWTPNRETAANTGAITSHPFAAGDVYHYNYALSYSVIDWGWIHVGLDLTELNTVKQKIAGFIGLLAIPALVIGIGVSFLFARRLTKPIASLQQYAEKIAGGEFGEKVTVNSRDELGALADSMNQMAVDLKESIARKTRLREKEILLKEIHHRVKNNMQILSSLLRMQARQTQSEDMQALLRESESRIRSMGLIHEKLYQSESISDIDFGAYARTLTAELIRVHSITGSRVEIDYQLDDIRLGLDTAMPCGLILNELVSNCLKYAFPGERRGNIRISMAPSEHGRFQLRVADDGIGLPSESKPHREGSLGTKLVDMLVDQLDGTLNYRNGDGTQVTIEFAESQYTERV